MPALQQFIPFAYNLHLYTSPDSSKRITIFVTWQRVPSKVPPCQFGVQCLAQWTLWYTDCRGQGSNHQSSELHTCFGWGGHVPSVTPIESDFGIWEQKDFHLIKIIQHKSCASQNLYYETKPNRALWQPISLKHSVSTAKIQKLLKQTKNKWVYSSVPSFPLCNAWMKDKTNLYPNSPPSQSWQWCQVMVDLSQHVEHPQAMHVNVGPIILISFHKSDPPV